MKKSAITTIFFLLLSASAINGQAALLVVLFGDKVASENFFFSIKTGLNYSDISNYYEGDGRIGFRFGMVANIKLNDRLSVTPEFIPLSPRGVSNVPVLTTGNPDLDDLLVNVSSTDRVLNYIDVPVFLKWHITKRLSLSAGPQVGFLTTATDVYESDPIEGTVITTEIDIRDAIKWYDIGVATKATFALSMARNGKGLNLNLGYTQGFIDILKDNSGDPLRNHMFTLGVSFPFIEEQIIPINLQQ